MSLLNRLERLVGPSTTDELKYTCVCGAPMENTAVHTGKQVRDKQYRVETWQCMDEECGRSGRAFIFENDDGCYGKGVLEGKVP
jgi:hypothetical protein